MWENSHYHMLQNKAEKVKKRCPTRKRRYWATHEDTAFANILELQHELELRNGRLNGKTPLRLICQDAGPACLLVAKRRERCCALTAKQVGTRCLFD